MCEARCHSYRSGASASLTTAHAKHDIPEEIVRVASRYPSVRISYGKPIGIDEEVVKAVYHRMKDIGVPYENARVVLIGREVQIQTSKRRNRNC